MKLTKLGNLSGLNPKGQKKYETLSRFLKALNERELPEAFVNESNKNIEALNKSDASDKELTKQVSKTLTTISNRSIKQLKLVPKNYYKMLWMGIGMATFGTPMGVVFGVALDNFAFFGIGLPIGMTIGMAVGANMDQKAQKEGRQLDIDLSV